MELRKRNPAIAALMVYALIALVHIIAHSFPEQDGRFTVIRVSQWLLMPTLAVFLFLATTSDRKRLTRLVLLALFFSWLGDTAPSFVGGGDAPFLTMVGFFLLAQIAYIAAFWPFRDRSFLRTNHVAVLSYAAAFIVLVMICAPGAGSLLIPVLIYGVLLTTMAVLASGLGKIGALGGALFFVSDAMIAIRAFAPDLTVVANSVLVMTTYIAAQALLVAAVLQVKGTKV